MELFATILTLLLFGGYVYFSVSAHNALKDVCEESIKLVKEFDRRIAELEDKVLEMEDKLGK